MSTIFMYLAFVFFIIMGIRGFYLIVSKKDVSLYFFDTLCVAVSYMFVFLFAVAIIFFFVSNSI